MSKLSIRALTIALSEVHREAGAQVSPPTCKVVAAAAIANPLAGRPMASDLSVLEQLGAEVSALLVARALEVLGSAGVKPNEVRGYGKGAIVGTDGELEHSAAILHPRFGAPVRAAIGGGTDIIPGTKKVAGPGSSITMPIGNKDDRWVFDDMDAAEISIPDAPRADEILVALVLSAGGRPHARVKKPS
jgi:Amino acid synthesis